MTTEAWVIEYLDGSWLPFVSWVRNEHKKGYKLYTTFEAAQVDGKRLRELWNELELSADEICIRAANGSEIAKGEWVP